MLMTNDKAQMSNPAQNTNDKSRGRGMEFIEFIEFVELIGFQWRYGGHQRYDGDY
jgi:hypothetical protein